MKSNLLQSINGILEGSLFFLELLIKFIGTVIKFRGCSFDFQKLS